MKRGLWALILSLAALLWAAAPAQAQGCSACRDNTAGSAPQVRRAFRKAIPVLGVPAALLFIGVLVLAAKTRPGSSSSDRS